MQSRPQEETLQQRISREKQERIAKVLEKDAQKRELKNSKKDDIKQKKLDKRQVQQELAQQAAREAALAEQRQAAEMLRLREMAARRHRYQPTPQEIKQRRQEKQRHTEKSLHEKELQKSAALLQTAVKRENTALVLKPMAPGPAGLFGSRLRQEIEPSSPYSPSENRQDCKIS